MHYARTGVMKSLLLSGTALFAYATLYPVTSASAQCAFAAPAGNDTYTCSSGTFVGNLVDNAGNNTLLMPEGGTGTIDGSVTFGGGVDTIIINSGTITGSVQQGSGIDDFQMTGGIIQSLNQGDNRDTFFMSGGRIIDAFDDGDVATMTGGRIGRVNMKLDNNIFNMSGGIIDRNLVAGFGNDTITITDGTIGGNISLSGGTDIVTIRGGSVGGDVLLSVGTDRFVWENGGIIYGAVDLGGDNDTALLRNLTDANIGATPQITGGLGTDSLVIENVTTSGVARFQNWEGIALNNDTELTFDGTLTLGDTGTGTGSLSIDATSTIFGGNANGAISAFTAGQLANVTNAGRIDLTNGGSSTSDRFTITGNYVGDGGLVFLNTELADDSSASDRLVISQGNASGQTGLGIVHTGGNGAETVQDGIMVIEAINGATTDSGAFALTGRVAAGAYEYFLFKGGTSAGSADNWYLRSTLPPVSPTPPEVAPAPPPLSPPVAEPEPTPPEIAAPAPPPSTEPPIPVPPESTPGNPDPVDPAPPVDVTDTPPPVVPDPEPTPAPTPPAPPPVISDIAPPLPGTGATPPTPGASAVVADVVPLYRIEVPTYAVVPPVAHHLALTTLGTFHERRGEQAVVRDGQFISTSWGRIFGQDSEQKWGGTVAPTFDGNLFGFQAGQDLLGWESSNGGINRAGLFGSYVRMDGDIRGQALGWNDLAVGELNLNGTSLGAYWTHIAPTGWYLDGVLMGTWFSGDATSSGDVGIDIDGTGFTASLEGGYPIALGQQWTLEPQAQLIYQRISLDDQQDRFSSVSFDSDSAVTGRLGVRLQGDYKMDAWNLQPYLKANLWHGFDSDQTVNFGGTPIITEIGGTSLELGGGVIAKVNESVSLFATADYTTNLGGEKQRIVEGNIGISFKW
jgi:autotransporter family porin